MLVERTRKGSKSKLLCPSCGGKLGGDKDPVVSDWGFIYRKRICLFCSAIVRTKQEIEQITHVEVKGADTAKALWNIEF